jgi:hypothetical protein
VADKTPHLVYTGEFERGGKVGLVVPGGPCYYSIAFKFSHDYIRESESLGFRTLCSSSWYSLPWQVHRDPAGPSESVVVSSESRRCLVVLTVTWFCLVPATGSQRKARPLGAE